jgi:DNA (cytosine-5)-methyltransferase 1
MADVVAELRPIWVVGENVPGLLGRGLGDVHADLERLGYRVRTGFISACEVGAPQPRKRLFVLAHSDGLRCDRRPGVRGPEGRSEPAHRAGWAVEPRISRVAYGVPGGLDRRRALGNAVVPQVAEAIGRLITEGWAA